MSEIRIFHVDDAPDIREAVDMSLLASQVQRQLQALRRI